MVLGFWFETFDDLVRNVFFHFLPFSNHVVFMVGLQFCLVVTVFTVFIGCCFLVPVLLANNAWCFSVNKIKALVILFFILFLFACVCVYFCFGRARVRICYFIFYFFVFLVYLFFKKCLFCSFVHCFYVFCAHQSALSQELLKVLGTFLKFPF